MLRKVVCFVLLLGASGAGAQSPAEGKAASCAFQAQVVSAVQKARIDRVRERKVQETVLAAGPDWPEKYNRVISLVTPWVYEMKMRDVKKQDLAAAWKEMCMQQ